jgi:hypothetical protein
MLSGMYLALLSRQRSSLPTVASRCCPSIRAYSARGGVRRRRSRFRLAAHVSMGSRCRRGGGKRYILEEAQQVGNSFPLAVGQHGIVYAVSGAAYTWFISRLSWSPSGGGLTAAAEETITEVGDGHGWRRRRGRSGRDVLLSASAESRRRAVAQRRRRAAGSSLGLGRCDGSMSLVMLSPALGC